MLDGSTWVQLGGDIDGKGSSEMSGWTVSMSSDGNRVAIGAPSDDSKMSGDGVGHVRVYEYMLDGSTWVQLGG
eukprot:CAMPEP_0197847752 /NCGR_PEP_ID=MMETSP1438-20131217/6970_1 /TAXON_ID=1461541 /ORGANISM="Pterosperma sp., Strain CCMP1384" /LENGTH=72 /DNA_ID=CAMNT_0043459765 /DNA_START=1 /DNA_END=215 /DNA_ORIENTATION=-